MLSNVKDLVGRIRPLHLVPGASSISGIKLEVCRLWKQKKLGNLFASLCEMTSENDWRNEEKDGFHPGTLSRLGQLILQKKPSNDDLRKSPPLVFLEGLKMVGFAGV